MLPFPKLLHISAPEDMGDYPLFLAEMDLKVSSGLAIKTPVSGADNNSPYWSNNNVPITAYCPTYTAFTSWALTGSSFNTILWATSHFYRIAQHAFPTLELFNYSFSNKIFCMIEYTTTSEGSKTYQSITRNNFTSEARTISGNTCRCIKFVYFDNTLKKMMVYNPSINSTPTPYFV